MGIATRDPIVSSPLGRSSPAMVEGAMPPDAIARAVEELGVKKAHLDTATLFGLAVLGGAFVALGGLFYTIALAGADGHMAYGMTRLVSGLVFSLGLILVVVAGAQLFTSDCLMVMAWASGRSTFREMMRVWTIVWVGNLVGAVGTAMLSYLSGQHEFGHGLVGDAALHVAVAKSNLPIARAFFLGILCNVLVCLAVWSALAARSVGDKILAVLFPVSAFVAAGFEHCVANMYFIPLGLLIEHAGSDGFNGRLSALGRADSHIPIGGGLANLAAVTLGNWVGGAVLVGATCWFVYRRNVRDRA